MSEVDGPDAQMVTAETRFHQMVRREGGISREQAIAQARAEIEEAKSHFDEWLSIELKEFTGLIEKVEAAKADPNWTKIANHHSRQLRDSATIMGFDLLAFVAGSLCEILDSIENGGECSMASITCHIDALLLAGQPSYRELKPEQVPDLADGLHRVVQRVTAAAK
jgi:hypothetical protein